MSDTAINPAPVHGPLPGRRNADGHPCPPWCITDHHRGAMPTQVHMSERASVKTDPRHPHDMIEVGALDVGTPRYEHEPMVTVAGFRLGADRAPSLWVKHHDAVNVAALVDMLATATPEQHHELAAAIRQAAASIMVGNAAAAAVAPADPDVWAFQ